MTSRVSGRLVSEPSSGESSTPDRAAVANPSAQAALDTMSGLDPLSWTSSGLSTTARIRTPSRVPDSRKRRATATATAAARMISRWTSTPTLPICTAAVLPKKGWGSRGSGLLHTQLARPVRASSSPIGTAIRAVSGARRRFRITSRSMAIPAAGASTATTITRASGAGSRPPQPSSQRSCQ